jgi:hypothetical protein
MNPYPFVAWNHFLCASQRTLQISEISVWQMANLLRLIRRLRHDTSSASTGKHQGELASHQYLVHGLLGTDEVQLETKVHFFKLIFFGGNLPR